MCVCVLKEALLDWVIRSYLGSPRMAVSYCKGQEFSKLSVCGAIRFSSLNVLRKAWRIPVEALVFSLWWKPGEVGFNIGKGMAQHHDR